MRQPKRNVEAVFFDLDQTLIHQEASFRALADKLHAGRQAALPGVSASRFWEALWKEAAAAWKAMTAGEAGGPSSRTDMFRRTLLALDADPALAGEMRETADALLAGASVLAPGAKETLAALRRAGIRTGIVTNGYADMQWRKIRRHGLGVCVDAVIVSETAGFHKPHPGIFEAALAALGARPETALHVGDLLRNDVGGARAAGLWTALYDPEDSLEQQRAELTHPPAPDHVVRHLLEAPELAGAARERTTAATGGTA